jgi:hypothetical protein
MRRILVILILCVPALRPQSTVTGSRTVQGNWDASAASATKPAKAGAALPSSCSSGEFFFNTAAASGQNIYLCNPSNTWTQVASGTGGGAVTSVFSRSGAVAAAIGDYTAAQVTNAVDATASYTNPAWISSISWSKLTAVPANVRARAIGSTFSGGGAAIPVGSVNYFTIPFACTISAWSMTIDTGSATIDVWKAATGTAIPTVTNTITGGAIPAISSGSALHSTTSVTANDIIAFQIKALSSATLASLILECDQ